MAGIAELAFMKASGMYDDDQAYRQRVQKYNEAVNQLQYNEQSGQFDYLAGSDKALRGQYNEAMGQAFQEMLLELGGMQQQIKTLENDKVATSQANAIYDSVTGKDYSTLNNLIGEDPKTNQMFKQLGVQAVYKADFKNPDHMSAYKEAGINPAVVQTLMDKAQKGELSEEAADAISKAWPIIQGPDNKLSVASLSEFIGMTGLDKKLGASEKAKQMREFIARSYSSLQGITDETTDVANQQVQANTRATEAKAESTELSNAQLSNWAAQFEAKNGRPATIQDYLGMQTNEALRQNNSVQTADMKDAQYFGNLKMKVESGTASDKDLAIYDEYLMKRGGTAAARNRAIGDKGKALLNQGIDISDPNFDIAKLPTPQKTLVNEVVRNLETTEGGKKLTANIAKKLGDDLGAVESTATKLTQLVTDKNVNTDAIMNATSKVQAYLPDSFRNVTAEDLRDQEFRSAYLSSAAVFLKLQSGLTVNEAEAARFNNSFGTLNKNTKVNMTGLKSKLDEVVASYEKNSMLEPDLYNIKYKAGVEKMKQTSQTIDNYLYGKTPPTTQTALPIEKTKQLDQIFGGGM